MSTKIDNLSVSGAEKFSDLENRLERQVDDESVLAEIHVAIKELLSNSGTSEARIREILQKRYDAGELRPESFELVKKMLDRIRTDNVSAANDGTSTLVLDGESSEQVDGAYAKTLVLGDDPMAESPHDEEQFANTAVLGGDIPAEKSMGTQLQIGTILRDRFLLQEQVFGGYTGVVYKALDQRLAEAEDESNFVTIKVLPAEVSGNDKALRALQQEVAKGRCLNHPNIVRCIDLDREDDLHFIVMEWLEGKSLATILDESGSKKIDYETTMDIVKQVSLALDYAHQRGVVHGDVNPGNIRITRDGEVKLFDFGIARVMQKEQDLQPDFDPRELGAKSPEYSSMQVLTGESPVPADDVFSLGCLMYRLIAGYRVFGPRSAAEAAAEGMEPQRPPGLTDKQWQALRKSLAYSRVPRFKTPSEFMDALGETPRLPPVRPKQTPQAAQAPAKAPPPPQTTPPSQTPGPPRAAPPPPQTIRPPQAANPNAAPQATPPVQPMSSSPSTPSPRSAEPAQAVSSMPTTQARQGSQPAHAMSSSQTTHAPPAATPPPQVTPPPEIIIPDEPMVARNYDIGLPRSPWRLVILGIMLIVVAYVGFQQNMIERIQEVIPPELAAIFDGGIIALQREPADIVVAQPDRATADANAVPDPEPDLLVEEGTSAGETIVDPPVGDTAGDTLADDTGIVDTPAEDTDAVEPVAEETVAEETGAEETEATATDTAVDVAADQAELLPADLTVGLVATGQFVPEIDVTLREDNGGVTIDLVRMHNMREPLTVLLEEVGFSGNRSPWEEGQYVIASNGVATFDAGQSRVRTSISMSRDTMREADRDVTIQVREIDNAESEFARINLKLEDDDRRAYEASLPMNTVAFAASEVFVSEADPAVQIEVVRFKPDNRPLEVPYAVRDLTTTAGEDYFPPGLPIVYFSPGQRSARILIPLVQDSEVEESEVFALEFTDAGPQIDPDIYQRIAVMIRDDE